MSRVLRRDGQGRLADPAMLGGDALRRVLDVLNADGEEARVVGGAVRNALLGRPIADVDIATTAEPGLVMRRAKAAGLRAIPTGLAHGTVTIRVADSGFEVTTLRRDIETDGRHARVLFSRDFREDAERRDFTINALSVDAAGLIHDTVGGLEDLAAGRVRFIGDADRRIAEDHLRILRFFRFHAAYGCDPVDAAGLAAAIRHRQALASLSRERVRTELLKLIVAEGAIAVLCIMDQVGIAALVLGGPADPGRLARLATVERLLPSEPDALLRLAALGLVEAGDAARLQAALRLSNGEARRLLEAFEARSQLDPARPADAAACLALLFTLGRRAARDGVMLAAADAGPAVAAAWSTVFATVSAADPPILPFGGAEVMARGVPNGRRVGLVLKEFQAAWIRAGFPRDPAVLSRLLDAAVAAQAPDAAN